MLLSVVVPSSFNSSSVWPVTLISASTSPSRLNPSGSDTTPWRTCVSFLISLDRSTFKSIFPFLTTVPELFISAKPEFILRFFNSRPLFFRS